ncbi:hypothetical protein [Aminobacter sp. HY435]|uniref:hypothetical protein n=1 Tax=Aminobacter sp. HY435 TaxID=2970917 RepID=UPI0022B951B7|nr:hypothetical protein [Aminobacter sp. HY435]
MDTQPRAEDQNLPQDDAPEHPAPEQIAPSTIEQDLVAAEEALLADAAVLDDASEVQADAIDDAPADDDPVDDIGDVTAIETADEAVAEEPSLLDLSPEDLAVEVAAEATPMTIEAPAIVAEIISDEDFAQMVDDSLEAVGGILLFKMRIDEDGEDRHVAAASIGDGGRRQFLLLSLPVTGGKLRVESASRSTSPLAKLAEAYVGVVEAFRAAA